MSEESQLVLPVDNETLPQGFCPASYQDMLNQFSAHQSVTFPSTFAGVTVSTTKPANTTQAWLQLDSFGRPVRLYYFAQGAWLSLHPDVPGKIIIWDSALPDFTEFDGGDAGPAGPLSGPMWEEVTELRAKFPIGAGTLPSATVLSVGDTGGEEKHSLLEVEMPPHVHSYQTIVQGTTGPFDDTHGTALAPFATRQTQSAGGSGTPPAVTPHNNMPPYYVVYMLRRTSRLFYTVT